MLIDMPAYATAKIGLSGDKELKRIYNELPGRVIRKGMRRAMDKGSTPTLKVMRFSIRKKSGLLKRAIAKKIKTYPGGNVVVIMGADASVTLRRENARLEKRGSKKRFYSSRIGKKLNDQIPAYYIHLVELGHEGPRPAPPHPFVAPALEQTKAAAVEIVATVLAEVIDAEAKKLGKI